jgi:hypothetical protein
MKQLKYTGIRTKPFTAKCPSGGRYPVEPEVSRVIDVAEEDALHLLGSEPGLWLPPEAEFTPPVQPVKTKVK